MTSRQHAKIAASLLFCATVAGCVTTPPTSRIVSAETWSALVSTKYDDYSKTRTVVGPRTRGRDANAALAFAQSADGQRLFAMAIYTTSREWQRPTHAYDIKGTRFEVSNRDYKVGYCSAYLGCDLNESSAVHLTEAYITQHADTGIDMQVYGKGSPVQIFVPPEYIQAFLAHLPARNR